MAIVEKLQNIINEKAKQKDVTNYGLPSASQIDNNTKFIEYPDYMYDAFLETLKSPETLWANIPKVTGTGTSVTLNDTADTKMRMTLSASEITQASTPTPSSQVDVNTISGNNSVTICGKNVFNIDNYISISGYDVVLNNPLKTEGTYVVSCVNNYPVENKGIAISFTDSATTNHMADNGYFCGYSFGSSAGTTKEISKVVTQAQANSKYMVIRSSEIANISNIKSMQIQLESGSTATTYTPYVSQQATLNLGDIEYCKIGNYEDEFIRTSGKNLFDASLFDTFTPTIRFVVLNLKPNTDYTLSSNLPTGAGDISNVFIIGSEGSPTTPINGVKPNEPRTITSLSDGIIRIGYRDDGGNLTDEATKYWYMLNEGSIALNYEPYGTDEWYIKKNVGKVVFNGSENWNASSLSVTGYKSFYTSSAFDENKSGFCNRFRQETYRNWIDLLADNFFEFANNSLGIRIQESIASDLQSFKSWLSNNNVIIYGVEKTPTYTKITGTLAYQLEDVYNNSIAYDGQTNITQANNDLPFIINAEIPSGFIKNFTRLNYIQSSATQYLSISDFYPTNNTRIKTRFEGLANTNTTWVFGARQGYQNKEFGFHATNGYTDCYGNDRRVLSGYNLVNGLELDKNKATTNINNTHTLTHTANTFTAPCPLNIFALNNNGTQGVAPSALKMYYFEIYENDVLIHNLIPAKRKSDNEIGMYDLVSGTFYTNQGTGSFSGE